MSPDAVDPSDVDLDRLAAWMDTQGLGVGLRLEEPRRLGGGTQNILLRFRRGDRVLVLRRPPAHKRDGSDATIRREARVLAALAGTAVPHPALVAHCDDLDVIGAAFYLMEPVDGFNPTVEVPEPHASGPELQRDMGLAVIDGLLALSRVEPDAVGLADLGRPDGWADRQAARWWRQLESYPAREGEPDALLPGVATVRDWLTANQPRDVQVGLIHGDFHLANVLVRRDGAGLDAIVDWELATQGDPFLDLGHLLATWPDGTNAAGVIPAVDLPGLPAVADLLAHYSQGTTRVLDEYAWFHVLACYRLGIILEGNHSRALMSRAPMRMGLEAHARAIALIGQARGVIQAPEALHD